MNSDPATPNPQTKVRPSPGALGYICGGLSFIPCVGIFFGLVAIGWGLARMSRPLIGLGISGILFTVIIYSALFYFGFYQRGGIYDDLRKKMAVVQLNETVRRIEYYKIQNGHYPAQLTDIVSKDSMEYPSIQDPTAIERGGFSGNFYYQLDPSGTFYYLRSVGPDGLPFTRDDILPTLPETEREKTGLRLQR